jgi:hypothetical protein
VVEVVVEEISSLMAVRRQRETGKDQGLKIPFKDMLPMT